MTLRIFFGSTLLLLISGMALRAEPEMRPALLGQHPHALQNLIKTDALLKRGQGDAIVLFSCAISPLGDAYALQLYRATPGSEMLKEELKGRFNQAQFQPALYRGVNQFVYVSGTVVFKAGAQPHLRIYLHQEEDLMKQGVDFIAPQMMFALAGNTKWKSIYWPPGAPGHEGVALLRLSVSGEGLVTAAKVKYEHPAGLHFGAAAIDPIYDARFLPGYRQGKPCACSFDLPIVFSGPGVQMKTG